LETGTANIFHLILKRLNFRYFKVNSYLSDSFNQFSITNFTVSRKKSDRFALSKALSNVLESGKPLYETIKGQWNEIMFEKKQPIVLELGCGKGEYTVGLAQIFPEKNFIGVDIKGDRIAVGAKFANENSLLNVAFLRTKIHQLLDFFEKDEISEIWITFPDPQPLKSGIKRRLTNPRF
jgi:tRNA (guanine-N7-)-methyltransferase